MSCGGVILIFVDIIAGLQVPAAQLFQTVPAKPEKAPVPVQ